MLAHVNLEYDTKIFQLPEVYIFFSVMKGRYWVVFGIVLLILFGIFLIINNSRTTENQEKNLKPSPSPAEESEKSMNSSLNKKTYDKAPDALPAESIDGKTARIKTSKGDIVFKFFTDAPIASSNFIFLTNEGFYNGLTFHRREEGFVIQGGDPNGNGTGGPGYKFNDEPVTRDYKKGIVAMANSGPNTNGSQFFVMLADNPLPKLYTIFGEVVSGMEVVNKIAVGDVMEKVIIE